MIHGMMYDLQQFIDLYVFTLFYLVIIFTLCYFMYVIIWFCYTSPSTSNRLVLILWFEMEYHG